MRSEEQLRVIAQEYEDISFVILSDIWLDQPKVHDLFDCAHSILYAVDHTSRVALTNSFPEFLGRVDICYAADDL